MSKTPWYIAGLHFECSQCGACCSGPDPGYIWITNPEIELLADHLKMSADKVRMQFCRRIGIRLSLLEHRVTKDCIFLQGSGCGKGCAIYPVRPNQCRTWPFWDSNLRNPDSWNFAAVRCPGINRGRFYSFEEIEAIRKQKKWWNDETVEQSR